MRLSIRFLLLLFPFLAAVVVSFNLVIDKYEAQWEETDLYNRASVIFKSIRDPLLDSVTHGKLDRLHRIYKQIGDDLSLAGVVVCSRDGKIISRSPGAVKAAKCDWELKKDEEPSLEAARLASGRIKTDNRPFNRTILPLSDDEGNYRGYVLFFHDPTYLTQRGELTRRYMIYAFLGLALFISLLTLLVHRWSVSRPIEQISEVMKAVMTGDTSRISEALESTDFAPLVKNLDEVLVELRRAKGEIDDLPANIWTGTRLNQEVEHLFGESRICVLANREPLIHNRRGGRVEEVTPMSDLVRAVEPIVRACSGLWVAHGSGTADAKTADKNGMLLVPQEKPEYAIKRLWLNRQEEQGYYYGFANDGLWPLCHIAHARPKFRVEDWQNYVSVNAKFVNAFNEEMRGARPVALVQDYHLALVPGMIRTMRPDAVTGYFWHIPWPSPEGFRICPWKSDMLQGILGADLIGFQNQVYCNNFLDTVDQFVDDAKVSRDNLSITLDGRTVYVRAFPTSVEWPPTFDAEPEAFAEEKAKLLEEYAIPQNGYFALGVDRLDYTKGIVERFLAVEKLLEKHPEMVGRFVLVQIAVPSRTHNKLYQDLHSEVQELADQINWRFHNSSGYQPIILRQEHYDKAELFRHYRAADVLIQTSLHDAMCAVVKEFMTAKHDNSGALVLSQFSGAARELKNAFLVNPYDVDGTADMIHQALTTPDHDRRQGMMKMRHIVSTNNAYAWGAQFLKTLHSAAINKSAPEDIEAAALEDLEKIRKNSKDKSASPV